MALTGLEIFKLLPKTNCKKCGKPTCLAFAMQLAQKKASLDECPCASEEAKEALAAAAAPPMRMVKFGSGDSEVQIGQETVLFRHDEKFYSPTVIAVTLSDKLSGDALQKRIDSINALQFERVGIKIGVKAIAVVNDSGDTDAFATAAATANDKSNLALILCSDSVDAIAAALAKTASAKPLIASVKADTAEAMGKLAKENGCPVVATAGSIEELADLTEKINALGAEDIVLNLEGLDLAQELRSLSRMRVLSLKKVFRPLGHPTLSVVSDGDADEQLAAATGLICKYAGIVIVDATEPYAILPMLTAVMNIYSDPQKPIQVEPKINAIGEPDENSPVMFTTNFSLTYYTEFLTDVLYGGIGCRGQQDTVLYSRGRYRGDKRVDCVFRRQT